MEISNKYDKYKQEPTDFSGFKPFKQNYWIFPRQLDFWIHQLSGAELKVLLYIIRHTWGYSKEADAISYSQFEKGIYSKRKRKWYDRGTGLGRKCISSALKSLEEQGFIRVWKRKGLTTVYRLRMDGEN